MVQGGVRCVVFLTHPLGLILDLYTGEVISCSNSTCQLLFAFEEATLEGYILLQQFLHFLQIIFCVLRKAPEEAIFPSSLYCRASETLIRCSEAICSSVFCPREACHATSSFMAAL